MSSESDEPKRRETCSYKDANDENGHYYQFDCGQTEEPQEGGLCFYFCPYCGGRLTNREF